MNIFVLDEDPRQAARDQCDKHVVKMPLESAQMLCTALRQNGQHEVPYKAAHVKHPCTLWSAATRSNFLWLVRHGLELCEEYTRRYKKVHASQSVIVVAGSLAEHIPEGGLTTFAQAMPDECKHPDPVVAYRTYYVSTKQRMLQYTKRPSPDFLTQAIYMTAVG